MNKYHIETGKVYEYDTEARAYIHIGRTTQYTKKQLNGMRNEMIEAGVCNKPYEGVEND